MNSSTAKEIVNAPTNALFVCPTPRAVGATKALLFHLDRNDIKLTTLGAFSAKGAQQGHRRFVVFDPHCYTVATPEQLKAVQDYEQRKNLSNKKRS